jgi:hypothetical protein
MFAPLGPPPPTPCCGRGLDAAASAAGCQRLLARVTPALPPCRTPSPLPTLPHRQSLERRPADRTGRPGRPATRTSHSAPSGRGRCLRSAGGARVPPRAAGWPRRGPALTPTPSHPPRARCSGAVPSPPGAAAPGGRGARAQQPPRVEARRASQSPLCAPPNCPCDCTWAMCAQGCKIPSRRARRVITETWPAVARRRHARPGAGCRPRPRPARRSRRPAPRARGGPRRSRALPRLRVL